MTNDTIDKVREEALQDTCEMLDVLTHMYGIHGTIINLLVDVSSSSAGDAYRIGGALTEMYAADDALESVRNRLDERLEMLDFAHDVTH